MKYWACYRLVLAGKCTWVDLYSMSLNDVDLLNIALDAWEEAGRNPPKKTKS